METPLFLSLLAVTTLLGIHKSVKDLFKPKPKLLKRRKKGGKLRVRTYRVPATRYQ